MEARTLAASRVEDEEITFRDGTELEEGVRDEEDAEEEEVTAVGIPRGKKACGSSPAATAACC